MGPTPGYFLKSFLLYHLLVGILLDFYLQSILFFSAFPSTFWAF
jgi:hypothetical protein